MFKIGDKVVCIDDTDYNSNKNIKLSLYKSYIISGISNVSGLYRLKNSNNFLFSGKRFILLSEFRKRKINKIKINKLLNSND